MKRAAFAVRAPKSTALRALNYSPLAERVRSRGDALASLGSLMKAVGESYGAVFTRLDCETSHGVELMSQSDMFSTEPRGRIVRKDSMPEPPRHEVRRLDILIAGAGTLGDNELYGRAILADSRLSGRFVGPDAVVLRPNDPNSVQALFAYAFLASPTGLEAIRSTSYGTKVLRIRLDLLGAFPIPSPKQQIQQRVAELVRTAIKGREHYSECVRVARSELEALPPMQRASELCAAQKARARSWDGPLRTMSAWNHISTGGADELLRKAWASRLASALSRPPSYGLRFARVACDPPYGVDLLSQRDVFMIRPAPRRIVRPESTNPSARNDSTLLVAARGQVTEGSLFGRVELAEVLEPTSFVTGDIVSLEMKPELRDLAYTFLSTAVGRILLRSTAVGTSIPAMHLGLLEDLPFPSVSVEIEERISRSIAAAIRYRKKAEKAEADAVRLIEEQVLPLWLA